MSTAKQATITNAQSILDNVTKKGLQVINPWIRDFPELMYVGMYIPNGYADGGRLKRGKLTYAEQKALTFKSIGALETDMTIEKNEVVWHEAAAFSDSALITADNTADPTITIDTAKTKYFEVGDVVVVVPGPTSTATRVQAEIVAINKGTGAVTLDTNVTTVAAHKDTLQFAYNLITHGQKVDRGTNDEDITPMRVFFQKFGGSVKFDSQEINQSRLFVEAEQYVRSKFSQIINRSNNNFARAFYLGRNIGGTKSETQGLDHVIAEREANGLDSTEDFTGVTNAKDKAKKLVEVLNRAASAPVYNGSEIPTVFCNTQFITNLSEIMYDMANTFHLIEKEVDFGLQAYSSPFFRNVQFIVAHTLNNMYPNTSIAYVFPKHLVTFRAPEYQSVNEAGVLVKTNSTGYAVLKQPQTTVDIVEYSAQITLANIFAGQTYSNTYIKITGF